MSCELMIEGLKLNFGRICKKFLNLILRSFWLTIGSTKDIDVIITMF